MLLVIVDGFKMVSSLDEAESCSHMYMSAFLWQTSILVSNSCRNSVNNFFFFFYSISLIFLGRVLLGLC